jgi:daunorubicin resistance ABC transporter ATP-binding subunit
VVVADQAIVVEGLRKNFGEIEALAGVDLSVPTGKVFGLLGPNGAGKTTCVRILATIIEPDGGRAEVLGHDVVKEAAAVRRRIGLAGQYAAIDPNLTGRENLRMVGLLAQLPRADVLPRADQLLERFGLTDAANRTARTYSGGMRRRLDVAASLVGRPPVLFLDEPTTGLDLTSRNELWDMIRELVNDGTTVLLTTQYLEEADRLANQIAVVDGGKVIANDTPERLKSQLGTTVVELEVSGDDRADRALKILSERTGSRVEREDHVVRITSDEGAHFLIEALRSLDSEGLEPETLTVRAPSLDDVFMALTGHKAEQAPMEGEQRNEGGRARR